MFLCFLGWPPNLMQYIKVRYIIFSIMCHDTVAVCIVFFWKLVWKVGERQRKSFLCRILYILYRSLGRSFSLLTIFRNLNFGGNLHRSVRTCFFSTSAKDLSGCFVIAPLCKGAHRNVFGRKQAITFLWRLCANILNNCPSLEFRIFIFLNWSSRHFLRSNDSKTEDMELEDHFLSAHHTLLGVVK